MRFSGSFRVSAGWSLRRLLFRWLLLGLLSLVSGRTSCTRVTFLPAPTTLYRVVTGGCGVALTSAAETKPTPFRKLC